MFLPDHLKQRIIIDAIILKRHEMGWRKINHILKYKPLYVKKTYNPYIDSSIYYKYITRLNTSVYMLSGKAYVWFKRMNHNPNMYYYCPQHLESISQDIYSTNSNGDFLDDCIDSDEEVNFSYCQKMHVIQESSYEDNSDYDSSS